MQVSGLSFDINNGKAENVKVGSASIDPNKSYRVVTNNFVAAGGDGYKMLKGLPKEDTGFVDADAFREYVAYKKQVSPKVEGRITIK